MARRSNTSRKQRRSAERKGVPSTGLDRFPVLVVQLIVPLVVLAAALYIILSAPHEDSTLKWAFGIIGLLLGQRIRLT